MIADAVYTAGAANGPTMLCCLMVPLARLCARLAEPHVNTDACSTTAQAIQRHSPSHSTSEPQLQLAS